jgi:SAM-dependent methyltransferase
VPTIDPATFARFYRAQYADYEDDLPTWLKLADRWGDPVLELGCGPGRVLFQLAAAGHQIAGLDNDPHMLALAREALSQPVAKQISLHRLDMTDFEFGHLFGLIIVPCNTFAYLDDDQAARCLRETRRHLQAGHPLAIDLPNPHLLIEDPPDPDDLLMAFTEPESGHAVQLYVQQQRRGEDQLEVTWLYDELLPDGKVKRYDYFQRYHLRSAEKMVDFLSAAGFSALELFGGYDNSPLGPDSARMLVVAKAG